MFEVPENVVEFAVTETDELPIVISEAVTVTFDRLVDPATTICEFDIVALLVLLPTFADVVVIFTLAPTFIAVVTFAVPVIVAPPLPVIKPVTPNVFERVALPVTAIVFESVEAPVTFN